MNRKRRFSLSSISYKMQTSISSTDSSEEVESFQLVSEETFEQSFSENDIDVASSSVIEMNFPKKSKIENNCFSESRAPFQEIGKNSSSRLSPSDTFFVESDKDESDEKCFVSSDDFRFFSQELNNRVEIFTCETPSMLITKDMGSPKRVWSILHVKDDLMKRDWTPKQHSKISFEMRTLVVDWMAEVCADKKLHRETFHLSLDLFDRFLKLSEGVQSVQLQLIGTSALVIASKIEEIYPPKVFEICDYTDGGVAPKLATEMEQIMLVKLNWSLNPVTSIHWLALYCQLLAKAIQDEPQTLKRRSAPLRLNFDDSDEEESNSVLHEKSFLQNIDGVPAFDSSFNESMNLKDMNMSYSEGHLIVNQTTTVPKMMREGFCCLAKALDLVITSEYFLKYRYGDLAAAVLFCSYEPTSLIEQVTGKKKSDLVEIIDLVQFYVEYCEKTGTVLQHRFNVPGVPIEDQHNIQTYDGSINEHLDYIAEQIKKNRQQLKNIHKNIKKEK